MKELTRQLRGNSWKVAEMHSDLEQEKRDETMLDFKAGKVQVIVATDILARGIDVDDIEMVVNYDVPREAEDYVHRIGRTARANRDGRAITFVSPDEVFRMKRIEALLEKEVPKQPLPEDLGEGPAYSAGKGRAKAARSKGKPARGRKDNRKPKPEQTARPNTESPQTAGQSDEKPKRQRSKSRWHRRKPDTTK